jgi:uncharacterized protein YggU (UPF0235/DUF167 family)
VTAPPERGRANEEVVELVAAVLGVRRAQVTLVAGTGSRDKLVELRGIDLGEAERRLELAGRRR